MSGSSNDDSASSGRDSDDGTTDELESGTSGSVSSGGDVEDSGEDAIARLGLEARAELQRLRERLGLLEESDTGMTVLPGVVGRYRLIERIGQGGMGVVYRAHDPQLGRAVAIKLVHAPAFAAPDKLRARLLREAKLLAKLAHGNVVRVYDCGEHEGEVYLAMEHVAGRTLREWQLAEGRRPEEIIDAYVAAASGLAAAHDMGIVHRDFKPENVLVADDGRILVGDFGLAVGGVEEVIALDDDAEEVAAALPASMTKTGALLGTVLYMSPEQLRGEPATAASDQFAFCVALWEALAGKRPFEGDERGELLAAIEKGPTGGERIAGKLWRALVRGLSLEPRDRFPELRALAEAIARKRGPSGSLVMALVGASIGAGLLSYPMLFPSAPRQECALERTVAEVRDGEGWNELRQRLDGAGLGAGLERLELHLTRLEEQAKTLCERNAGPGDEALRQHLQSWVESLGSLVATAEERSIGDLLVEVEALESARLTGPPPRALDERVVDARDESRDHERRGDLAAALQAAERAVELAGTRDLELAVAHKRRGRVLALRGEHAEAMQAYGAALSAAEASLYDDLRLEVRLYAARTALMRLEQLDRGRDALDDVRGLLGRLHEPWPSLRRAEYYELHASLLKRQGETERALGEQWLAILQHTLLGSVYEQGLAYFNLGTIYERRALVPGSSPDELRRARVSYEHALEVLAPTQGSPAWFQASVGLGHWLATHGGPEELDRAERLLERGRASGDDLRVYALADLVVIRLQRKQAAQAGALARELLEVLPARASASPRMLFDAWIVIASASAATGDQATLERARVGVRESAAALETSGTYSAVEIATNVAGVDLTAAFLLVETDPVRARAFARSARERLLALPVEDRPADMLDAIEGMLANGSD